MKRVYPLAIVPLTLLIACNPAYQRPSTKNSAYVRFVPAQETGLRNSMSAYIHDSENCGTPKKVFSLGGGIYNFGGGSIKDSDLGMPKDPSINYPKGQYYETTVVSDKRFYFSVTGSQQYGECYMSGSFLPEKNANYEITYNTDQRYCYLKVSKIFLENNRLVENEESTFKKRSSACSYFFN